MAARLLALCGLVLVALALGLVVRHTLAPAPPAAATTPAHAAHAPAKPRAKWHLPPAPADVRGARARRMKVPILMFHVVTAAPRGAAHPQLWVSQQTFAAEMRGLRRAGYHAISLRQAFDAWQHGGPLPRKPVVISFDDGYLSQFRFARPVLRALGWPGVLNLELRNLGKGGLTEREVRVLLGDGWELDSHTLTHPDLTTITDTQLRTELAGSRRALRRRFGPRVAEFFCYPAGRYDARVVAAVRAAGYRGATTVDEGLGAAGDPFTLKRVRVNARDTPASLLRHLASQP
jgi:peptidoglycan/xylan/chitin deacetylase (PgdA/CDA1 family)